MINTNIDDIEWQQVVASTTRISQQIKNVKMRLQSALSYVLIENDAVKQAPKMEVKSNRFAASKSPIRTIDTPECHSPVLVTAISSPAVYKQNISKQAEIVKYNSIADRFQIGKFLGKGKFSDVFQAQDKQSKILVALKVIQKSVIAKYKMEAQLAHEIKIQSYLYHPNLLKLFGVFQEPSKIILILEYAPEGELYKLLKKQQNRRFPESKASSYVAQIIEGISYMHKMKVIHRDLKPENILISQQFLKIADLGLATYSPEQRPRQSFCGTIDYMCPEIASGQDYDHSVDLWSIGILAYELSTGATPFYQSSKEDTMRKIIEGRVDFPKYVSAELQDFVRNCLRKDPSQRMNLDQMKSHKWIQLHQLASGQYDRQLLQTLVAILK